MWINVGDYLESKEEQYAHFISFLATSDCYLTTYQCSEKEVGNLKEIHIEKLRFMRDLRKH